MVLPAVSKKGKSMGNLKEYSKEIKETAANLRIIDDALFRLMGEKPGVCEEILRTLLDMPHLQVVKVSVQSVVQSFQREITLDALCMTQDGRYCNVEVQKGNSNDDIRRTRFHAAALTAKYTPKGADFKNIPDVTIVYISEYDVLKNNQTVTHVTRCMKNDESYVPVKDGEDIIFANTCVNDGSDKSELLQLMLNKEAFYNDKFPQISNAISYFKETEGGQSEMCKIVEDYAKEYAKNSIQEAIEAKKLADEAKKLADEAKKLAEEEKRKAEEEKRKADEAESRAGKAIERNYRLIVNILSGRTYEEAADMLGISIEDVKEAEAAIKAIDKKLVSVVAMMSSFGPIVALDNLGSTLQNTFATGNRVLDILDEQPVTKDITGCEEVEFNGAATENVTF